MFPHGKPFSRYYFVVDA